MNTPGSAVSLLREITNLRQLEPEAWGDVERPDIVVENSPVDIAFAGADHKQPLVLVESADHAEPGLWHVSACLTGVYLCPFGCGEAEHPQVVQASTASSPEHVEDIVLWIVAEDSVSSLYG